MTIAAQTSSITVQGNSATTAFNYNFEIPYQDDGVTPAALVYIITAGVAVLVPQGQYGITGVGNELGGFVVYPLLGPPLDNTKSILIMRNLAYSQAMQFLNSAFVPTMVEEMGDRLAMQIQQLATILGNGGGEVYSFNTRTGAVTLLLSDVTQALGYTPFGSAGGTLTGRLVTGPNRTTAGFNIAPNRDPDAPVEGDIWIRPSGAIMAFVNGSVVEIAAGVTNVVSVNGHTGAVTLTSADTGSVALSAVGANNGVASLDNTGKVPAGQLSLHTPQYFTVASQAAMLASAAVVGDYAVRTDNNNTYVLTALPASTLGNWFLFSASGGVTSVNGLSGVVHISPKTMGIMASLVQDYGAVADGATNCLTAWNNAVSDINAGIIHGFWLPPGAIVLNGVTSAITVGGFSIRGEGASVSKILVTGGTGIVINAACTTIGGATLDGFTISTTQAPAAARQAVLISYTGSLDTNSRVIAINDVHVTAENLTTQGFYRGIRLYNVLGGFFTNSWLSSIANGVGTDYAINIFADTVGFGASFAIQFDNIYMQWWDQCITGSGDLQGIVFHKCVGVFSRVGINITDTNTTFAPWYNILGCQFETLQECVILDNVSWISIADNNFYKNVSGGASAIVRLSNVIGGTVHDNSYVNLISGATPVVDALQAINCLSVKFHDELIVGLSGIGLSFSGSTDFCTSSDFKFRDPQGTGYQTLSDASFHLNNKRRQGFTVGPPLDSGDLGDPGLVGVNVTTTPTSYASVSMPSWVGDRLRIQAYVFMSLPNFGAGYDEMELFLRIREYTHRPGTAFPYNVLRFAYNKNHFLVEGRLDSTQQFECYMNADVVFDVIGSAIDAQYVADLWTNNGTAILQTCQLRVIRQ